MTTKAIISVIDNLESTSMTDALSANQGRVLKELVDSANSSITTMSGTVSGLNSDVETLSEEVDELKPETWKTLTLSSGISEYNSSYFPCRFKKQGKIVFVEGAVTGISTSAGTLATLPEGYRPNRPFYYIQATTGGKVNTLKILANGNIERVSTTNGNILSTDYHFLNVSFIMN